MSQTRVIRVDRILDGGEDGKLYVGSSDGPTHAETVEEAIEGLSYEQTMGSATTRDVTADIEPIAKRRGEFRYSPKHPVVYIEVTTKRVVAVYEGSMRPDR
jgi:hypothetical protein